MYSGRYPTGGCCDPVLLTYTYMYSTPAKPVKREGFGAWLRPWRLVPHLGVLTGEGVGSHAAQPNVESARASRSPLGPSQSPTAVLPQHDWQ